MIEVIIYSALAIGFSAQLCKQANTTPAKPKMSEFYTNEE